MSQEPRPNIIPPPNKYITSRTLLMTPPPQFIPPQGLAPHFIPPGPNFAPPPPQLFPPQDLAPHFMHPGPHFSPLPPQFFSPGPILPPSAPPFFPF